MKPLVGILGEISSEDLHRLQTSVPYQFKTIASTEELVAQLDKLSVLLLTDSDLQLSLLGLDISFPVVTWNFQLSETSILSKLFVHELPGFPTSDSHLCRFFEQLIGKP